MPTFRKRGTSWRAEVARNGHRESATFATKREAMDWANRRELELANARAGKVTRWTLADVMQRYADEVSPEKAGARWEKARIASIKKDKVAKLVMQDIGPAELADWRDRRLAEVQGATVLREIGLLRAIWTRAKLGEWRYVDHDPWPDVIKPKDNPARKIIFTNKQIEDIVSALGYTDGAPKDKREQTAVAFLLALETAMRSGEILTLEWKHVHLERRMLHLPRSKNGDARDVPLSRRAVALLEAMKGIHPEQVFTVNAGLRDAYFRQGKTLAKVDGPTFHDARATAITRLSKKLELLELAKMVGHRDPRSLMIYYRESATEIANKLD
ncbi:tyrosine-type recombinase/integrase [Achromobacter xylosoxidans]|uniref:tyrosine-type recombinase/integrase n=1 Tax=Alcaligenes xylosoxydans xylosoxydans TaxID=85698 RepID=UPI0006C70253|nr:site-specific integrase [Achromobacter xylosoxidans]CUI40489.1 Site-specific recombinase XerD [Achromobacter xylosoxidans]